MASVRKRGSQFPAGYIYIMLASFLSKGKQPTRFYLDCPCRDDLNIN